MRNVEGWMGEEHVSGHKILSMLYLLGCMVDPYVSIYYDKNNIHAWISNETVAWNEDYGESNYVHWDPIEGERTHCSNFVKKARPGIIKATVYRLFGPTSGICLPARILQG